MPSSTATSEPGTTGAYSRSPSTSASDASADEQRQPARVAEVAEQVPELLEEVALALGDAEQLRHLADDDRQREADDEALQHRLGDEAREEAEPQRARRRARGSRPTSASVIVSCEEGVRSARGEVADRRRRQRRSRGHRPGDEVPRAAERGVEDQRARRRVQADDRRDAGDRRVGERLGTSTAQTVRPATRSPRSHAAPIAVPSEVKTGSLTRRYELKPEIASPISFAPITRKSTAMIARVVAGHPGLAGRRGSARARSPSAK